MAPLGLTVGRRFLLVSFSNVDQRWAAAYRRPSNQSQAQHEANRMTQQRMTTAQAAEYLGLAEQTLRAARSYRAKKRTTLRKIPYLRIGGRIFYLRDELDAFVASCRVEPKLQAKN